MEAGAVEVDVTPTGSIQEPSSDARSFAACASVRLRGLARCFAGASISSITFTLMILARRAARNAAPTIAWTWCSVFCERSPRFAIAV